MLMYIRSNLFLFYFFLKDLNQRCYIKSIVCDKQYVLKYKFNAILYDTEYVLFSSDILLYKSAICC